MTAPKSRRPSQIGGDDDIFGWLSGVGLTDERGLLTGRILADLGADVVAVEPVGGSSARRCFPGRGDTSYVWDTFAANKRGITADLEPAPGSPTFWTAPIRWPSPRRANCDLGLAPFHCA